MTEDKDKKTNKIDFKAIPFWGWIGVTLCAVIPFITLGGAVPSVIGFCGAYGCYYMAKMTKLSTGVRVALVFCIVLVTWVVFFIAMAILHNLMGK